MSQICRTCLEEILDSDFVCVNDESATIRDELLACVPELDLSLIPDATMCVYCANSLHAAYNFKQKCLQSEEKIRSHKGLDLVQIKQELESNKKFDVVHGAGVGLEVIFIRDDDEIDDEIEDEGNFQNGQFQDEVVHSFLNCDDDDDDEWIPEVFLDGTPNLTQNNSIKSNSRAHSINKKILKNTKQEPKSSFYESNNTNTRSNRLAHSFNGKKALKCDLCTYTTSQETLLKLHVKTHSADKPYHCPKCTYQTSSRQGLQNHLRNCNCSNTKKSLREVKSFKCTECTFEALKKEDLQEHVQVHLIKNYKCTKCSYETSNLSTFKRHVSNHVAEKPHKCKQCGYGCNDLMALRKHMSNHKANKLNKCHLCSYRTEHSNALAIHIKTHTGERSFMCTLCEYKAVQKGNLKNHMKHHTTKGPFKCTKCSYSCTTNGSLQSHMRKCHRAGKKERIGGRCVQL